VATWSANVPPARRIGPRESRKANIEAAEIARLYTVMEALQDTIETGVADLLDTTEDVWVATTDGLEGCIAQTELGT